MTAPAESTVILDGRRLPAPAAALANGALVHGLDFDDTHGEALVHATAAVLPPVLAVAEQTGASGADALAAAVAAYETVIRLGAAVPHGFHARGFHATSVCGTFAAALAAAKLMGLSRDQAVNALGLAGSAAAGSLEFLHTGSSTKQLHPGMSAMAGITAARLAAAGADGPSSILEGEHGLFRAYTGREVDAAALTAGLGERWEVERITIKPYPACQLVHAPLDALRSVINTAGDPSSIAEISFEVPKGSVPIVCEPAAEKRRPRTPYEGKFSLPYCAAALLLDGDVTVGSFEPAMLARSEAHAVADRVRWTVSRAGGPPAEAPGVVAVKLRSGKIAGARVARSRGGPDAPLDDEALHAKLAANCGPVDADRLAKLVASLGDLDSVAPVLEATLP